VLAAAKLAEMKGGYAQPDLSNGAEFAKDVVHLFCCDLEGEILDEHDPVHLGRQPGIGPLASHPASSWCGSHLLQKTKNQIFSCVISFSLGKTTFSLLFLLDCEK
jgi:hypothetical protein